MQCNKNTMNTRVIKGNQFTQDMMIDPRQFVMGEREFNYKEVAPMQQIQPLIMKGMYEYCCGSVKNRGIMHGMKYLKKILVRDRKNTKYCLKLDIKKFYPSIDKQILKNKFLRIIKDRDTLDLIDIIIDSTESGVPIRKLYQSMVCKFLFTRLGSLY